MRWRLVCLALALLLAVVPVAATAAPAAPATRVQVDAREAPRGILKVRLQIP
ncbi:MAG: hypothetical protein JOY91_11515, partial [Sinobacteraceae bacterium]|nr:hypothetical protein [Nevskiaceae bacterium]